MLKAKYQTDILCPKTEKCSVHLHKDVTGGVASTVEVNPGGTFPLRESQAAAVVFCVSSRNERHVNLLFVYRVNSRRKLFLHVRTGGGVSGSPGDRGT